MAYLHRRAGGTYYFRRAIPEELRPFFNGRREWFRSLGTKDRTEAKRFVPDCILASDAQMDAVRASSMDNGQTEPWSVLELPRRPRGPLDRERRRGAANAPVVSLLGMFDAYAMEQRIKPATANEWRSIVGKLIAFVGHDDATALTVDDLDRWRDSLLSETNRKGVLRDPRTVKDKYLSAVRATLNWAVEKRQLSENVATKVVVRVPRKPKLRERDFTPDEAKAILGAALRATEADIPPEAIRARRWIPWLCAYTGARVNELSQLRGKDVAQIDGIWTVNRRPKRTPYRRVKGTPFVEQHDRFDGRTVRAGRDVGRA